VKRHRVRQRARVTRKGQVTIPKEVRELFRFKPGDQLEFIEDEGGVRLGRDREAFQRALEKWRGYLKDDPFFKGRSTDEIIEEMRGR
jgi:AbrB family looped-hinge helix DNA binding protein